MYKFLFFILFVALLIPKGYSQLTPVSIEEKVNNSSLIIEGKVVQSKCYSDIEGNIFSIHQVEIYKVFKGGDFFDKESLEIITRGGTFQNVREKWSHLLELSEGDKGIFFLYESTLPAPNGRNDTYQVYSSGQGFIHYTSNDKLQSGTDFVNVYNDIENLITLISDLTAEAPLELKKEEKCVKIIANIYADREKPDILIAEFALQAPSEDFRLGGAEIIVEYNSQAFGEYIVANGLVNAEEFGLSSQSVYSFEIEDISATSAKIKLSHSGNYFSAFVIGNQPAFFGKLSFSIQSLSAFPIVTVAEESLGQSNGITAYEGINDKYPLDCYEILYTSSLGGGCPIITSFSPDTLAAGAGDTLTIIGTNFGEPTTDYPLVGSGVLFTKTVNSGSTGHSWITPFKSEYVQWTDSIIQVIVPLLCFDLAGGISTADTPGSGIIGVYKSMCTDTSATDLYINYAVNNQGIADPVSSAPITLPTKLTSRNSEGGYDLYFTPQFKSFDTLAVDAFSQALVTWRCATGVNFRIREFDSIPLPSQPNACRIDYGSMPAGVPAALVAYTNLDNVSYCGTATQVWHGFQERFSLIFSNSVTWYTFPEDTTTLNWIDTLDLQTVALHELGHAHQLLHTNNPQNLMYYLVNGYKRQPEDDDLEGGLYVIQISAIDTIPFCQPAMQQLSSEDCADLTTSIQRIYVSNVNINIFPNPSSGRLNIEIPDKSYAFRDVSFRVVNSVGQYVFEGNIDGLKDEVDLSHLSSGIYFLIIQFDNQDFRAYKVIKK